MPQIYVVFAIPEPASTITHAWMRPGLFICRHAHKGHVDSRESCVYQSSQSSLSCCVPCPWPGSGCSTRHAANTRDSNNNNGRGEWESVVVGSKPNCMHIIEDSCMLILVIMLLCVQFKYCSVARDQSLSPSSLARSDSRPLSIHLYAQVTTRILFKTANRTVPTNRECTFFVY